MLDGRVDVGGRLPLTLPTTHNALAIVMSGRVRAGAREAAAGELVLFENDGAEIELVAIEAATCSSSRASRSPSRSRSTGRS